MKSSRRLSYDAPVTLTFSLICTAVLLLSLYLPSLKARNIINALFTAPGSQHSAVSFNYKSVLDYLRLFIYVFGHTDWNHLLGNMAFILLLGPLMEERYGSGVLALMMAVTALVAGVINACFIPTLMHGASGIVFMLIMLTAITSFDKNQIPLSALLVMALYIGRELIGKPVNTNIAAFAHIAGGLCGSLFGFFVSPKRRANSKSYVEKSPKKSPSKKSLLSDAEKKRQRLQEIDDESPRKSPSAKRQSKQSDETIIGDIKC